LHNLKVLLNEAHFLRGINDSRIFGAEIIETPGKREWFKSALFKKIFVPACLGRTTVTNSAEMRRRTGTR